MASAQNLEFMSREPFAPIVRDAPYAGEGVTTLSLVLGDGTRIERSVTARLYRDSAGRVRREQTVMGLAALNPARESQILITIVDPVSGVVYTLDPSARIARRVPINKRLLAGMPPPPPPPPPAAPVAGSAPPPPPAAPPKPTRVSLGTRQLDGYTATGERSTTTIPVGQIGNDRAIEIVDERWESPELQVLVSSHHRDPRTGDVEYRLTNIARTEPPQDLFAVPSEYTIVDAPPLPPPPPPARR